MTERAIDNLWEGVPGLGTAPGEDLGFPTQKTEALSRRVIAAASNSGDLVLDAFIGSGTTAAAAQKLGRRWIGCDINKGAIQTTTKRLAQVIREQVESGAREQIPLADVPDRAPRPAQLSFGVWRVNEYDLQIQHNEAVNLAVEHLGVERTRADPFFDGTLGSELVKIVPFDHSITLLDLQATARELEARPDEERNVVAVGLGRELACEGWLADHNRHRPINKIRLIELRSDPTYGRFFEHRPASARIEFERLDGAVRVRMADFVSPSILDRLSQQEGILSPQVDDWRAMVDSVFIDPAYDGEAFNVGLADIPERKSDFVRGEYTVARPASADPDRPVAVKITDMLGEEVLVMEPAERDA